MKTLVITIPAMGKTTLVKRFNGSSLRGKFAVDFDMPGVSCYTDHSRALNTQVMLDLFKQGKQLICGFNGTFDLTQVPADVQIYICVPYGKALSGAAWRSYCRQDSQSFTDSLCENANSWCLDLIDLYYDLNPATHANVHLVTTCNFDSTLASLFCINAGEVECLVDANHRSQVYGGWEYRFDDKRLTPADGDELSPSCVIHSLRTNGVAYPMHSLYWMLHRLKGFESLSRSRIGERTFHKSFTYYAGDLYERDMSANISAEIVQTWGSPETALYHAVDKFRSELNTDVMKVTQIEIDSNGACVSFEEDTGDDDDYGPVTIWHKHFILL